MATAVSTCIGVVLLLKSVSMNTNGNDCATVDEPSTTSAKRKNSDPQRALWAEEFGRRCRSARGGMDVGEAAAALGVHRNTIWNIERGLSVPDAWEINRMASLYQTTTQALLSGEAKPTFSLEVPLSTRAVERDGFIYVPHFDVRAYAGDGGPFDSIERVKAMRPFDAVFIRRDLRIAHNDIVLHDIWGNSMEPLLHSRDVGMADLRSVDVHTEGIHLLRLDGALLVKRVQRLPGKVLRVTSENTSYDPFEISGTEDRERDFAVLGRTCWAGITLQ